MRWCWVNFQCRGVLLIWIIVWQGPTALAIGAGIGCLAILSQICRFSFFSLSVVRTLKLKKGLFFEFNAPAIRKDEFSIL